MALALTGFSVVAGGLLGWVNDVTAEPIAQANAKTLSDAIAVVVPGFDNNPAEMVPLIRFTRLQRTDSLSEQQ